MKVPSPGQKSEEGCVEKGEEQVQTNCNFRRLANILVFLEYTGEILRDDAGRAGRHVSRHCLDESRLVRHWRKWSWVTWESLYFGKINWAGLWKICREGRRKLHAAFVRWLLCLQWTRRQSPIFGFWGQADLISDLETEDPFNFLSLRFF